MTISSQAGVGGIGLQPSKVGKNGVFDATKVGYYKMRSPRIGFGPVQRQQIFPLEVGGTITPTGS
jgi:hypothetical protein